MVYIAMKKILITLFLLVLFMNNAEGKYFISARGNNIGEYNIFSSKDTLFTITKLSFNILGFKKEIYDTTYAIINPDYTLKSFYYKHVEGRKTKIIRGSVCDNYVLLEGDDNRKIPFKSGDRIYSDIGIELFLRKIKIDDSLSILSSGLWDIKKMRVITSKDTTMIISSSGTFEYIYKDNIFIDMIGPGGLKISQIEETFPGTDILNSYKIKAIGDKISETRMYKKIVIEKPDSVRFNNYNGFQSVSSNYLFIKPRSVFDTLNDNSLLISTNYYDFDNPIFKDIIMQLKLNSIIEITKYIYKIMKPHPNMYPEKASEIFSNHNGDCSEYATLLTALLRASNYPAYNVYGLIFMKGYYYYHAWVRVKGDKGWFCVDPTRGCICDAKYIILQEDKTGGFSKDIKFLPISKLKIMYSEVLDD